MYDTNTPYMLILNISTNQNVGYKAKMWSIVNIGGEFTPSGITIDFQDK